MFPTAPWDLAMQALFNQELRSPVLDVLMPLLSSRALLFVALSGLLVWRCAKLGKSQATYFILLVLCMGASDLATNQVRRGTTASIWNSSKIMAARPAGVAGIGKGPLSKSTVPGAE